MPRKKNASNMHGQVWMYDPLFSNLDEIRIK